MGFKNVFNKLGLIEDEVPVTKGKTAEAPKQAAPTQTRTTSFAPTPEVVIDPDINEMLAQSLEENKLAGFDYLKFSSAVEEMKSFGGTEDARYKMAFSTAKQMGVSKKKLLDSGDHYLNVLTQDETDFNSDCDQFDKKEVQARETKLSQVEAKITDLTKQLAQLQEDHGTLTQELQEEKTKLESRKTAFQVTLQNFRANIESNIQKINQYL